MDIQYVIDIWSCIAYITSYMCKPEKEMSQLMKHAVKEADTVKDKLKAIGNTFLHSREVSQHEAIPRLISLPLRQTNVPVKHIPTGLEQNRTRMLKSKKQIAALQDNDTNIFMPNIIDRYIARPDDLESMSMAEFASFYIPYSTKQANKSNPTEKFFRIYAQNKKSSRITIPQCF